MVSILFFYSEPLFLLGEDHYPLLFIEHVISGVFIGLFGMILRRTEIFLSPNYV